MTYRGTIKNGVVQLEPGANLPDGTPVEVRPLQELPATNNNDKPLLRYAQLARHTSLPSDLAAQHDHYIHGTPKR